MKIKVVFGVTETEIFEGKKLKIIENIDGRLIIKENDEVLAVFNSATWRYWKVIQ